MNALNNSFTCSLIDFIKRMFIHQRFPSFQIKKVSSSFPFQQIGKHTYIYIYILVNYIISDLKSNIIFVGNMEYTKKEVKLTSNPFTTSLAIIWYSSFQTHLISVLFYFQVSFFPMTRGGMNKLRNSEVAVVSRF